MCRMCAKCARECGLVCVWARPYVCTSAGHMCAQVRDKCARECRVNAGAGTGMRRMCARCRTSAHAPYA